MIPIEAVSVCIGYGDFLAETARWNRSLFLRWVIVTSPDDKETHRVCHANNLDVLITEDFIRNGVGPDDGGVFNKGRCIQRGFEAISAKGWVLHVDADIVIPPEFHESLRMVHLDERKIYGCDRMMVVGWDAWNKIKGSGYRQHGYHCYTMPHEGTKLGNRWTSPHDGYVPIGFFQLMHGSRLATPDQGIWVRPYPNHHGYAARADVQFGLQWDRRQRELIPELLVWHLASEVATLGKNWNGRKTKRFGPDPNPAKPTSPCPS